MIECSCIGELRRELSDIEREKVYSSDLGYKLTLGQENFLKIQNYDVINKTFFKKLSKIRWNNNSKSFNKILRNFGMILRYNMIHIIKLLVHLACVQIISLVVEH